MSEVHQVFSPWVSQVVRQYAGENYAEAEWMVGPIPVEDNKGKEIITKYSTRINNGGIFYTDSNGRQTLQRKRNFRPTWNLDLVEPVAGKLTANLAFVKRYLNFIWLFFVLQEITIQSQLIFRLTTRILS